MSYFFISVIILAALLFFPVSHMIWVLSVRRLQRKWQRTLTPAELAGQRNRARFISLLIVLIFSALFNLNLVGLSQP